MVSIPFTKTQLEKSIICNQLKWKGLLIESLKKITVKIYPLLESSDEVFECVEILVMRCLEILTSRSTPHTVQDIENQVKLSFPEPLNKWVIKESRIVLGKNKKNNDLLLPTNKIHNLLQKYILRYKLDYTVALYITAVLEYIASDILTLVCNYVKHLNHVEIDFQDLHIAITGDSVLMDLFHFSNDNNDFNYDFGVDSIKTLTTYEEVIKHLKNNEQQYTKDLNILSKIFKKEINCVIPIDSIKELNSIFNKITRIFKVTTLLLNYIEDIMEMSEDKSITVGCYIEELAEDSEFHVYLDYANDIVKKQYWDKILNLINKPEVLNLLQSSKLKNAIKYYFPNLLLLPLWHYIMYFEYIEMLYQLSPSQYDKKSLRQVRSIFLPLRLKIISAAKQINLPVIFKEFRPNTNSKTSQLLTIEKLNVMQKTINGLNVKYMRKYCTEFIREGELCKVSNGGKRYSKRISILFDGVLLLCKYIKKKRFMLGSSRFGSSYEFNLKEIIVLKKVEIVDREDTDEIKNFFEIVPRLEPPVILVANTLQDKINWMGNLVMLNTKSILDTTLNDIILDEEKKCPLHLPSIEEYKFVEPDSQTNIIFEEKENHGILFIKGATLLKLIERLTCNTYADPNFIKTFLTTYRRFCSPNNLLDILIERYNIPETFGNTINSSSIKNENKRFRKEYVIPIKFRVLIVILQWVTYHYYDYQRDPDLVDKLHAFLNLNKQKLMKVWIEAIIEILKRNMIEVQKEITYAFNSPPPPIEVHMDFNENHEFNILLIHPKEFARQLTLIESKNYRAINPSELVGSAWTKEDKELSSPKLLQLMKHTTNFSRWIEKSVVECENIEERVAIVSRFIEVMMALNELNNFNGVLGVVSALNSAAVHRLKFTFQFINTKFVKALNEAQDLNNNHFKKMRKQLKSINPPCVPFIGMYLTNILHIEVGNSDYLINSPNLINFNKLQKVAEIIGEIQQYQNQPYCLNEEPKIKKFLEDLNPFNGMKDTDICTYLFNQSLKIEPRNCKKLQKYQRKWPHLNLKSPGIKTKMHMPSVSNKNNDLEDEIKLSSQTVEVYKKPIDIPVCVPITFTFREMPISPPPLPPRLRTVDPPTLPPRKIPPPLPPKRLPKQVEKLSRPGISENLNSNNKPTTVFTSFRLPSRKDTEETF